MACEGEKEYGPERHWGVMSEPAPLVGTDNEHVHACACGADSHLLPFDHARERPEHTRDAGPLDKERQRPEDVQRDAETRRPSVSRIRAAITRFLRQAAATRSKQCHPSVPLTRPICVRSSLKTKSPMSVPRAVLSNSSEHAFRATISSPRASSSVQAAHRTSPSHSIRDFRDPSL